MYHYKLHTLNYTRNVFIFIYIVSVCLSHCVCVSVSLSVASCHVLYGERIGLFSSEPSQESERFIWAVEQMLNTTPPLLYVPRPLLRFHTPLWTQHATAWDHIFSHGVLFNTHINNIVP